MIKDKRQYWLALLRARGIGPATAKNLLQIFPDISEIFSAKESTLLSLKIRESIINEIKNPQWHLIEKDLKWLESKNHHLVTIDDENYPCILKEIHLAPLLLFVNGDIKILQKNQIAIVGSRQPTYIGELHAYNFAKELAASGVVVTSGLAIGIDSESHKGALVSGKTIAVLGTGADEIYPFRNKELSNKIIDKGGAIISEFPIGTKVKAENFPRRNRIISGLSLGVLVVEATERSGSLITARFANEQGKEVFAIPGSIDNILSKGCHSLIRDGAKLVENVNDILEELPAFHQKSSSNKNIDIIENKLKSSNEMHDDCKKFQTSEIKNETNLDNITKKLLKYIEYDPISIDVLVDQSNLSIQSVSCSLLILELRGFIKKTCDGYVKIKDI